MALRGIKNPPDGNDFRTSKRLFTAKGKLFKTF
jgi:hypothetical protein